MLCIQKNVNLPSAEPIAYIWGGKCMRALLISSVTGIATTLCFPVPTSLKSSNLHESLTSLASQ
ncbi:hypothetical protein I7I50_09973 [Histoplasma capsulatum G186AR]|uniref:Uncharacterized protein n=1 Tax=Ajellomyces capsulatus TaxID=5037 RepID=A0A8H7Z607_AJECA|nr:hypothetical protein I7I52_01211 [Histoplasma capsulatum]QSS68864.1 hypothetical protein I7I50_09973 [Histoplasma capsulatum G186AR]